MRTRRNRANTPIRMREVWFGYTLELLDGNHILVLPSGVGSRVTTPCL